MTKDNSASIRTYEQNAIIKDTEEIELYGSIDKNILNILNKNPQYAEWIKNATHLRGGISGMSGYDIGVGKYLKLPMLEKVINASIDALKDGKVVYWDYPVELPDKIAEKLKQENKVEVDPSSEILLVAGISAGIQIATMAFLNPGDEVIVMDPDYVSHFGYVYARSAVLKYCPLKERKGVLDETRWYFDIEELEKQITPKTKMIMLCNPNNPTGYVYSEKDLKDISELVIKNDIMVFTNECYERVVFSDEFEKDLVFTSIASLPGMKERTITVQGITKSYSLSGYRVAWLFSDKKNMEVMNFVQHWGAGSIAPTISQWGTLAVLEKPFREDYTREVLKIYKENINILCNTLKDVPRIECPRPMGSQFTFADISEMGVDDFTLSQYLNKKGLITVYGTPWGHNRGKNHMRFALSNTIEYQKECVEKLAEALNDYVRDHC